ncbi:MAG: hypothetical protein V4547_17840 [Bacteroidota bacterium]
MLPEQKYVNPERTVSGTVNVETEDCVLNVTTSSVAATINLQTIPAKWNTIYKLFIKDASGNAATNNITIVAPAGYTINGLATATINTNNGSCIVRIVNATTYQGQLSSFSGTNTPLPYLYARKDLINPLTTYVAVPASGVNSVVSTPRITTYDSVISSNIAGFDSTTGIWTVAENGLYSLNAKMVTRLLESSVDSLADGLGQGWMSGSEFPAGLGAMAIAVIKFVSGEGYPQVICSDKQPVLNAIISDINVGCTQNVYYLTAGQTVGVFVLNKTNHAVVGLASRIGSPDCLIDFSITKIG